MQIYLKHKDHGYKVAYYEAEAEADKKNGWEEYDPLEAQSEENNEIVEAEKPRRGRPRKED